MCCIYFSLYSFLFQTFQRSGSHLAVRRGTNASITIIIIIIIQHVIAMSKHGIIALDIYTDAERIIDCSSNSPMKMDVIIFRIFLLDHFQAV